ncbi:MAG: serine hydrolase domain-containing protein [Woeseiaceae bacterium]
MNLALTLAALAAASAADMQSIVDQFRVDQQIPGVSVVVTQEDDVLFAGGSGFADLETDRPMTPDTILYAGSLSKIYTGVLTLNLAAKGRLELDAPVAGIGVTPDRSDSRITVRHLLTHASGLDREGDFGYWFSAKFPDDRALASYLAATELRSVPGEEFHYSNIGYAMLGTVAARATGQSYNDALHERVLQPLGLNSSGSPGPVTDMAVGYSPVNRVIPSRERPFAGLGRQVGDRYVREYHDAKAMTPAFGIYTTANDLSLLARFLLGFGGNAVLSDTLRSQMLSAQDSGWGLGIKIDRLMGRPVARHSGWFAAHKSHLLLDLQSGIAVVVMANADSAAPAAIAETLVSSALGLTTQ